MTLTLGTPARPWDFAPTLTALALFIALTALPVIAAMALDARQFDGESIWLKPLKFHVALVIYIATLAFFARYLPASWHGSSLWNGYLVIVTVSILFEIVWIGGAAALGTASHFNVATPVANLGYSLMGVAAVTLTSASLVMGIGIWRNAASGLPPALHLAVALGLILTFVLTLPVAGTMASNLSHHIGASVTGARLPILGWSREVGDLRAPHFMATHALHALPVAGWLFHRLLPAPLGVPAVVAAAAGFALLVAVMFAGALAGRPAI